MAKQVINVGSIANDGTGDTLRIAGQKINSNFTELYDNFAAASAQVSADWTATSGPAAILHKPDLALVATSGSYNDLSNKPTIFSGNYADLSNKPRLSLSATSGSYNDLINLPVLFSGSYSDLTNKPTLFSGSYADLTNTPTIPTSTSQLSNNSGFITSSSLIWGNITGKPIFATVATSGSYADLTNKPNIPSAYTLPTASNSVLGGVKVDGTTITINGSGVISSTGGGGQYLPGNATGFLYNNGSGTLSWASATNSTDRLTNGSYSTVLGSDGILTFSNGARIDPTGNDLCIYPPTTSPGNDTPKSVALISHDLAQRIIVSETGIEIYTSANGGTLKTWDLNIDGTTQFPLYKFPYGHGTSGQTLTDDGSGNLAWTTITPATGLQTRTTASVTTTTIANNATANASITGFKTYTLLKITTSAACWVRIYTDAASRSNDSGRVQGTDPLPGSGVIAEVISTTAQSIVISPGTIGFNNESSPTTAIPVAITNLSGSSAAITVAVVILQLEA
jgi:hypothetical protein